MLTDVTPRKANRARFLESERIRALDLPQDGCLLAIAKSIESAMKEGENADVRNACAEFLATHQSSTEHQTVMSECLQPVRYEFVKTGRPNSSATTIPKPC